MGYVPRKTGTRVSVLVNDKGTCLVPGIVLGYDGKRLEVLVRKSAGIERLKVQAHSDFVGMPGVDLRKTWEELCAWTELETEAAKGADDARLDLTDRAIVAERTRQFNKHAGPRVGDFVEFADGVTRRISHDWGGESYQTSDGGSWHLSDGGHLSFSGSLFGAVPRETLTDTGELRDGAVWIFHHDYWTAHNGVTTTIKCRVFRCSEPATR